MFYLPLAVVGFSPLMFLVCAQIDTLYQFWIHTRTVSKLGPIEWVFNTPSHHRVHHAKNPKYIDKNHAGVLIIWDRLFGTFKEEEEEPVYGTATPLRSWNPVWANIHYWIELARLAWQAPRLRDKFLVWFMRPAWRPKGLETQGPPAYLTRAFYQKYDPKMPASVTWYVFAQFVPALIIGTVFIHHEMGMTWMGRVGVAGLVIMTLVCIGGLLEAKRWAFLLELLRLPVFAAACVLWAHDYLDLPTMPGRVLAGIAIAATVALYVWFVRYRPIFTRPFGKLGCTEDTMLDLEPARRPETPPGDSTMVSAK
jgi:hypothetical protein